MMVLLEKPGEEVLERITQCSKNFHERPVGKKVQIKRANKIGHINNLKSKAKQTCPDMLEQVSIGTH